MNLSLITWKAKAAALILTATALVSAGFLAGTHWVSGRLQAEKASHERDRATWTAQRLAGEIAQRAEENRREDANREIAHVAALARTHAVADRAAADDAHRRLLDAALARAAAVPAGPDPAVAGGSPAVDHATVLALVLGEVDDEAGSLAAALDDARIAGLACERAYRSLKENQ